MREKDEFDFNAVLEAGVYLDTLWLSEAICGCYGEQHPWLNRLRV